MKYTDQEAFASHQLVLLDIAKRVDKPVLELGAGYSSTKQIHDLLESKKIKMVTVEQSIEWVVKFIYLSSDLHAVRYYSDANIKMFYDNDKEQWGLVFIDNGTWEARHMAIKKYKDTADYVILHDCDFFPGYKYFGKAYSPINPKEHDTGVRDYSDVFKYWIEYFVEGWEANEPPTLLGSNKICLDDIVIEGMMIANRNK